jgi:hypothetical protein
MEVRTRAQEVAAAAERRRREEDFDAELRAWAAGPGGGGVGGGRIARGGAGGGARGARGGPRPLGRAKPALRILAEGDSWFDFPFGGEPFRKGDVIERLRGLIPYPILNLAVRGDEVRSMLGVKQRRRLREQLDNTERDFNVLLFSGGGNDIVGETFRLWLRDRSSVGGDATRAINDAAFGSMLQVVRAAYEDLIALRDEVVRRTPGRELTIFLHGYDWAIPTGEGVCGFGPWLKPSLTDRGWSNRAEAVVIVKDALIRFADCLADVAARNAGVVLVSTQGTLGPDDWNDELHPNSKGFPKIARKFQRALKATFPAALP